MRRYLITAFFARLADEGMAVAAVLLALQRADSAAQGAFTLTAWMAPHVLAAPLVGGLAARATRPRLFYCGALACFAAALAGLALALGRAPTPVTLAIALAGGACGPVVTGGLSGLLGALAPQGPARARAYALDAATYNAASVAGPAAVGAVATAASAAAATALLAVAACVAAALAALLPLRPAAADAGRFAWAAGLTAVARTPRLRAITAATCVAFLGIGGLTTTAVLRAADLGRPAGGGVLMTAFALGALAGSLVLARRPPRTSARRLATFSLLATGAALGGAALAPSFAVLLALFALAGVCDGPLLSATLRIRADHAPPGTRTQVFTIGAGLKITAAAAGAALAGTAAGLPPAALLAAIAALQFAAAAVLAALSRRPAAGERMPVGRH
ncbi:MFS transporter [Streptomyces johnsoniae]|uniref:MFS transporter n=1 Tax=Streptomyces johnsoniae TaxID=3075532 RepID=A0ABU2S2N3_9ACTN|nr:MFS transporter [Streptomyces sp. DSM 41886]MDT0443258.1 MFS transporter [Streptomyces sp. DSM 41886]